MNNNTTATKPEDKFKISFTLQMQDKLFEGLSLEDALNDPAWMDDRWTNEERIATIKRIWGDFPSRANKPAELPATPPPPTPTIKPKGYSDQERELIRFAQASADEKSLMTLATLCKKVKTRSKKLGVQWTNERIEKMCKTLWSATLLPEF